MTTNSNNKGDRSKSDDSIPQDDERKILRMWVFSASILIHDQHTVAPPMPLDVDNGLPGIVLGLRIVPKMGWDFCVTWTHVPL